MTTALIIIAIVLRLAGGLGYLLATIRGRVRPSAVSWFFWGITPMITFAVQMQQRVGLQSLVTLALGVGPLAIFLVTLYKHHKKLRFTIADIICACFAATGLTLWLITSNPLIAIACGILGDFFSAVPTITKSYHHPETEHAMPYFLSALSMAVALYALTEWSFVNYGFTLYMLVINVVFVVIIFGRIGARHKKPVQARRSAVKRRRNPARATLVRVVPPRTIT